MYEITFCHNIVTVCVKPTATAHMEKNFMTAYGKIMEHTLTGKAIRTQVFTIVWLLLILIKIKVYNLCVAFRLHLYIFQFKPV